MAQPIATHYDNLKVQRDAPVGVIKTSYRRLSQQYHPDRNPDPAALEIMKLINQAWDVLSDPERRARHDRAIAALERRSSAASSRPAPRRAPAPKQAATARRARVESWHDSDAVRVAGVLAFFAVLLFAVFHFAVSSRDDPEEEGAAIATPAAPEAMPMPAAQPERVPHGYLASSVQDFSLGVASVDIDNTGGMEDAEVRLFRGARAARSMFVHRGKHFVVDDLAPGTYVVKYKMVVDGKVFAYQERELFQPKRDRYIKLKIRLFDAAGSKRSAAPIAPDQF